jgi:hypothetical protein
VNLLSTRTRRPGHDPIPYSKLEPLGWARGAEYATFRGQEYVVDASPSDRPDAWAEREGALVVTVPNYFTDDVTGQKLSVGFLYRHAVPVPAGSFERASQRRRVEQRPSRPVDALNVSALRRRPAFAMASGTDPARGPAAILERLHSKGIEVRLYGGRLLVQSPGGHLLNDYRDAIERAEPLLVAHLSGSPARCELPHAGKIPEAYTILVGGLAACEAHASGELEL